MALAELAPHHSEALRFVIQNGTMFQMEHNIVIIRTSIHRWEVHRAAFRSTRHHRRDCPRQRRTSSSSSASAPSGTDAQAHHQVRPSEQPDHPVSLGVKKFAELLAAKSGGKLKVNEFPSNQLGNELQQQSACRVACRK